MFAIAAIRSFVLDDDLREESADDAEVCRFAAATASESVKSISSGKEASSSSRLRSIALRRELPTLGGGWNLLSSSTTTSFSSDMEVFKRFLELLSKRGGGERERRRRRLRRVDGDEPSLGVRREEAGPRPLLLLLLLLLWEDAGPLPLGECAVAPGSSGLILAGFSNRRLARLGLREELTLKREME